MARPPSKSFQKTFVPVSDMTPERVERLKYKVGLLVGDMVPVEEIAAKLGRGDKHAERYWRSKIRVWCGKDEIVQQAIFEATQGIMAEALPYAGRALGEGARNGRPDSAKLVMEATGFHNPRVKHEHSGDIKISLTIPRPAEPAQPVAIEGQAEEVTDAQVVDPGKSSES